jgi:Ca2+-transporting ATPase
VKEWYKYSIEEVSKLLETSSISGLSKDVIKKHRDLWGENKLPESHGLPWFFFLLRQFSHFIIWILIGAIVVASLCGRFGDSISIAAIVTLNVIAGFIQEYAADRSLMALKRTIIRNVRVIRESKLYVIDSCDLVVGDLVVFEAGDIVPADGRIIEAIHLSVDESILTGESVPVSKISQSIGDLQDDNSKNMLFMGTTIVRGKCKILVVSTGLNTVMGNIAQTLKKTREEKTPMQGYIEKLLFKLIFLYLFIILIIFLIGTFRGVNLVSMLLISVSFAVAAIPEGLPVAITIALAVGVRKMAKRHALVRKFSAVETLGMVTALCTDKTGTITKNELMVTKIWVDGNIYNVTGTGYLPEGKFLLNNKYIDELKEDSLKNLLTYSSLCNNALLVQEGASWKIIGDPTEGALLVAAHKAGITSEKLICNWARKDEFPFDSLQRRMGVICNNKNNNRIFIIKGAPDVILSSCTKIYNNGTIREITDYDRRFFLNINLSFTQEALRTLACAYCEIINSDNAWESEFVLLGLFGMKDVPRLEAYRATAICKQAGILPIMVTGDNEGTARAIATDVGIISQGRGVITGLELDKLSDHVLVQRIENYSVYARVNVFHKVRIVKALQTKGHIVAMTGDGVNDSIAVKAADVGIAMGLRGAEVTKEVADMVITDDNILSITHAIEEGRGVFANIMKFILFLVPLNIAELFIIFTGVLIMPVKIIDSFGVLLTPIQLLWINLIIDGFLSISLAFDPVDFSVMKEDPKDPLARILSRSNITELFIVAFILAGGIMWLYHYTSFISFQYAQTMVLTAIVFFEIGRSIIIRGIRALSPRANLYFFISLISVFIAQSFIIYNKFFGFIFNTISLSISDLGILLVFVSFLVVLTFFVNKLFLFYRRRIIVEE